MDIINPNEIGAKISTLIAESKEKFVAVTAFVDLANWKKILINLEQARKRGVSIKIFFRKMKDADFQALMKMGIELYQINGLHTKLYFNEKEVIVSSMNFYEFSDLFSIDIALHYKDAENYNKLYDYFQKYILGQSKSSPYISKEYKINLKDLHTYLCNRFSESKITLAQTYIFSKNLVPIFEIFINPIEISLKLPTKNPCESDILDFSNKLKTHLTMDSAVNELGENYKYCTWAINMENKSQLDFINVISELRMIN